MRSMWDMYLPCTSISRRAAALSTALTHGKEKEEPIQFNTAPIDGHVSSPLLACIIKTAYDRAQDTSPTSTVPDCST
jgi:hypothetical protein